MRQRLLAAWSALTERDRYLVVEEVAPLGWAVLVEFTTYSEAYDWRARLADSGRTRVMAEREWQRRTCEAMRSRDTWLALARLNSLAQQEVQVAAMQRSIDLANFFHAFQNAKHP